MKKSGGFNNNNPFIILAVIHMAMLLYTFYKKKDRKRLFVLLLANIGLAYIFDFFVVVLFRGYTYKPGIFKSKYVDHIFGAILSQGVYVPITALFITAFKLGWKVKLFFAMYFVTIERLFLSLKVYKIHWWRSPYTFTFVSIYFWLCDIWFEKMKDRNPVILFLTLFNMLHVTWTNILFPFAVQRKVRFGLGRFYSWKEHFVVGPVYFYLISLLIAWIEKRGGRFTSTKILGLVMLGDFVLTRLRLLKINSLSILPVIYTILMFISNVYRRWVYE